MSFNLTTTHDLVIPLNIKYQLIFKVYMKLKMFNIKCIVSVY